MSLSGSIEDLPLLEILQVVAFCQKTGHLVVRAPEGEAGVAFRDGRVVSGYAWNVPAWDGSEPREAGLRARLAALLGSLVRLREGEFAFNLAEEVPTRLEGRDLSAETLEDGINPEELMLELARKLDEDRRDVAAVLEASFVAPAEPFAGAHTESTSTELETRDGPVGAPGAVADEPEAGLEELALDEVPEEEDAPATVLLVDDEPDVLRVVGERLARASLAVATAATVAEARREATRLAAAGRGFLLVVDLGLPPESGTTFRAGLDVARHASGLRPAPVILLMAESIDEKLRARAKRLGVSMLAFKPWLSKLDPLQYEADLRAFGDKLSKDLVPRLLARLRPDRPVAAEAPATPPAAPTEPREEALRRALDEIRAAPDPDLVAFVLLRAARAFFPRAVLFVAKDDRLRGLAGFGRARDGDTLDRLARELVVPLEATSHFGQAVARGRAWQGPLPIEGPVHGLVEQVGAFAARQAAIVPVRALHETIAVVYGDDPDGGDLPPVAPFAGFVERAGRALEQTIEARRATLAAAS
ncbi:MAG: response regulator [Vicinamibacteria bacterium]